MFLDTGDAAPIFRRQYPIPQSLHSVLDRHVQAWIDSGKVMDAPRNSPLNLPTTVALKKDSITEIKTPGRICLDPRALNSLLQSDRYPLPLVSDIFKFLPGKTFFSGIDIEQSFLQLPFHRSHRPKLVFT